MSQVWFKNRRAKWRKQKRDEQEQLRKAGVALHSSSHRNESKAREGDAKRNTDRPKEGTDKPSDRTMKTSAQTFGLISASKIEDLHDDCSNDTSSSLSDDSDQPIMKDRKC